eukprot:UN04122
MSDEEDTPKFQGKYDTLNDFIKSGWSNKNNFMLSYGLKPYRKEDEEEALAIALAFMEYNGSQKWKALLESGKYTW